MLADLVAQQVLRALVLLCQVPIDICEQRDPKGLYKKARAGLVKGFTGASAHESCATHVMVCSALLAFGCVCILLWTNPSVGPTLHACPLVAHSSADIHWLARAVGQGVRTHAS